MRVRFCFLVPDVRKRPKPPGTRPGASHDEKPGRLLIASLCNGIWTPTTRPGWADVTA